MDWFSDKCSNTCYPGCLVTISTYLPGLIRVMEQSSVNCCDLTLPNNHDDLLLLKRLCCSDVIVNWDNGNLHKRIFWRDAIVTWNNENSNYKVPLYDLWRCSRYKPSSQNLSTLQLCYSGTVSVAVHILLLIVCFLLEPYALLSEIKISLYLKVKQLYLASVTGNCTQT